MKFFIRITVMIVPIFFFACQNELQVYRIGALLPLSGSFENYGRSVKNGLMLALNINKEGGIKGNKLDILFEDDGSDEKKAIEKVNSLVQGHFPLIIGGVTSNIALAVAPICEQNKVVLLPPTASSPKLSGSGQYKKDFPTKPDIDAAFAYDALRIIARAINNSTNYPQDLRSRIADTNFRGITGEIDFDANGDVNIIPKMFQIKGGQFVPVD